MKCDGCGEDFHVQHALICKKGGLITQRHNEFRELLGDLSCLAWAYTQKQPVISEHSENQKALRADLLINGVWRPQETASFDIRFTDTEATATEIQRMCWKAALTKKGENTPRRATKNIAFTPLIFSVDGMMARESKIFLRRLADRLASKRDKPYRIIKNWVKQIEFCNLKGFKSVMEIVSL